MAQQKRAIRTRASILRATAEAIRESGYDGASTTEVLRRAGVTRGALYFHFPSKKALAEALLEYQVRLPDVDACQSPLQSLIDVTFGYSCALQGDVVLQAAMRMATEEATYHPGATPYLLAQKGVADLLARACDRGELLPDLDVEDVAGMIAGAYTGIQLSSYFVTGREDLLHRVEVMWRTLLPGIAAPGMLMSLRVDAERARSLYARQIAEPVED